MKSKRNNQEATASKKAPEQPQGELSTRTLAMPGFANPSGDIFGGWVLSQMDIAGGIAAGQLAQGRVVTVAVDAMTFWLPVHVGDVLCVYTDIVKTGRTSMTIHIQAWALRDRIGKREMVTQGTYTFVAVDQDGKPRPLPEPADGA